MSTVLITGLGRGIGFQLAKVYVEHGYRVIGTVRSEQGASAIEALARETDTAIELHKLELTDFEAIDSFAESLRRRSIDLLINCAGIIGGKHQTYDDLDFEAWEQTIRVNTLSPMKVTLALLPALLQGSNPKVVNISSIMGSLARERSDSIAYRSSKAALNKAMQCVALDLKAKGIGVYQMHPGWVKTDMGGPNADITVEESAQGMFDVIRGFTLNESGRFWQYDGTELEW